MKYKVQVGWFNTQIWEVEANNEEDALDKASDGDGELIKEDWDLESVELYNND